MADPNSERKAREPTYRLARRVLFAFVVTFAASRTLVFLIMSGRVPNMFLFLHGTHVHHLNYGIFLLAAVGGYALFLDPGTRASERAALVYGIALALTFDEFGMWLHLGGGYWQRASVDAVVVVGAVIALIAYLPSLDHLRARHPAAAIVLVIAIVAFAAALLVAGAHIGKLVGPRLWELESASSH